MIVKNQIVETIGTLIERGVIVLHKDGNHGGNYPRANEFGADGVPFLTAKLLDESGRIDLENAPRLKESKADKLGFGFIETGDVLLSHNATVGRVAIVPELDERVLIGTSLTHFRLDSSRLLPGYLAAYFKGREFQNQLAAFMSQTTRNQVPITAQRKLSVVLPHLEVQKLISHILGTLDDKIELNRRMNETLEAMAQALFKSWFVDFDPVIDNALAAGNEIPEVLQERAAARQTLGDRRKPLPEEIQKLFPDSFVFDDELGWIPEGWRKSSVGEEFVITMGQSPPGASYNDKEEGIAFFQGRADFGFRYPTNRIHCTAPKRFASKGDTLVSVRAPVGDVNMALEDCCIGRGLSALRHKLSGRSFTYYSMLQLRARLKRFEAEGTVFGSINQKNFKALDQINFPEELIKSFEKYTSPFDDKIGNNSIVINMLSNLRDTLLPKLLSGELRIPDAEKLIEEIV